MSWWGCPTAEADTSSSLRTAVLLQSYVGVTAPGPAAVLVFTLPLSTGKRLVFLFSSLKPILAETLEADGTFLKDAGPYLPPSSHSETILLGPPSWTVQVSSCHSLLGGHQQSPKPSRNMSNTLAKLSLSRPSSYSEISCSNYTDLFSMPKDTRCSLPLCLCICGLLCLKLLHSLLSSFSAHRSSSYPLRPTPRISFSVEPYLFPLFLSQPPQSITHSSTP